MSSPLTVIVRITAKPGLEDRVKEELRRLLAPTRVEPGCLNFDLHQAIGDATRFLVHENWTGEAALNRHFEMPYIQAWLGQAEALLAEPMELTRWARVD
jgi:quinol monooxygenase YgiN